MPRVMFIASIGTEIEKKLKIPPCFLRVGA
jgi:hypothetical protein